MTGFVDSLLDEEELKAKVGVFKLLRDEDIELVRVSLCDISGISRIKNVPVDRFKEISNTGLAFPSALLGLDSGLTLAPGTGFDYKYLFPNFLLVPDFTSFRKIPWASKVGHVMANPYSYDGRPTMAAPRAVLCRLVEQYQEIDLIPRFGSEFEFFVYKNADGQQEPVTRDWQAFAEYRHIQADFVLETISKYLKQAGFKILDCFHENAPGQFEINFSPFDGVAAADAALFFKTAVKEIMYKQGYLASFMTKPHNDRYGCGYHLHTCLLDKQGRNLFYDPHAPDKLSEMCRHFAGGLLRHAKAVTALCVPTINGYKRMVPYSYAPINTCWGKDNRTVMIRIPPDRGEGTRLEVRKPEAAANPYIVMAGILAAGLDGIKNRIDPGEFVDDNAYRLKGLEMLPPSLDIAIEELRKDKVLQEMLGDEFTKCFLAIKDHEVDRFRKYVTDWERNEYLELF